MKIIQLVYFLSSGGAEKFVVDLANEQVKKGNDVTICMLLTEKIEDNIFNKQFLSSKVKFVSFGFNRGFSLGKVIQVIKYIRSLSPDVVHCHLNVIPYIFPLALRKKKIKFFHTLHNVAENAAGAKAQYQLNKYFYRTGRIQPVCISRLCQESYERFYGLTNAPYIDNGRAEVPLTCQYEAVHEEVESYKSTETTKVFIHVARCDAQKNQQLLINAFNSLSKEGLDFTLIIIGSGFDSEVGLKLQSDACSQIHFLGVKNNVNDYLHYADAFCLSSIYEGLPISLLEALSCGVTPICTPVGGIPDVITDGVNGYLSKSIETEDYITAVKKFIKAPILPDILKGHYNKNYSMESCASKYLELYNTI